MAEKSKPLGVDAASIGRDSASIEAVDPFSLDAPIVSEAEKSGLSREQALEFGRKLGADEADRRGDVGLRRQERIARAEAYAAWDYDGRIAKGQPKYVKPTRQGSLSERGSETIHPAPADPGLPRSESDSHLRLDPK